MAAGRSGSRMIFQLENPFQEAFKDFFERAEDSVTDEEKDMMRKLNEKILARTPVWEGDTIHNWRWSTRAPSYEHEAPIDNGPTGRTSEMPLGQEPRRKVNETRARQSLAGALRAREPVDIFLTNTSDSANALEYGMFPTPAKSRVNASVGIVRIALKEVMEGI